MSSFKETMYAAFTENNLISSEYFDKYSVKRGLRNPDGTGVMAGVTNICNFHGYVIDDAEKKPAESKLIFRVYYFRDIPVLCELTGRTKDIILAGRLLDFTRLSITSGTGKEL